MAQADRRFVVVSGLPGSGKTTVARALALLLKLPLFDKDTILEQLFDGTRSAAEVLASIQALPMRSCLGIGEPVVIDTTTAVQPTLLVQDVEAAFARCLTRLAADGARRHHEGAAAEAEALRSENGRTG